MVDGYVDSWEEEEKPDLPAELDFTWLFLRISSCFCLLFPLPLFIFYVSLCFMFQVLFQLGAMCEGEPGW